MTDPFEDESVDYSILVNGEGQYSLWPAFRKVPTGWTATGPKGKRSTCLDWIDAHWTDMRPKSLTLEA
jgi:MbtH protein